MSEMSKITGHVVFPSDAPARRARRVLVEVRNTSEQDAASKLLASSELRDVVVRPDGSIAFEVDVVATKLAGATFRVHVDWDGDGSVSKGDLLSTQAVRIDNGAKVPVTLI